MVMQPFGFEPFGQNNNRDDTRSLFQDVFETDPIGRQALFFGEQPQGLTPFQQSSFANMFEPTFNRYLGLLGQQVKLGQTPSLTFTDHLQQQDFGRQFKRFGQSSPSSRMTPQTRFLFGGR